MNGRIDQTLSRTRSEGELSTTGAWSPTVDLLRNRKELCSHRSHGTYGLFHCTFELPTSIDTDKVKADFKKGILTVTMPKKASEKSRQIPISG